MARWCIPTKRPCRAAPRVPALVVCAIGLLVGTARADALARSGSALDRIADTVETTLREGVESGRSSAAFAVYVRSGEVRFSKSWGFEDPERRIPTDPSVSRIGIASIGKTLVAIALAQIKERHVIRSFDDPANRYLGQYKLPDWQGQPITLRQLATHTAGLDEVKFDYAASRPEPGAPTALDFRAHEPALVRPPGRFSSYSSFGFGVLAQVIADVTGQPASRYVEEQILRPLGMSQTLAAYPDGPIARAVLPFQPVAPHNTEPPFYSQPMEFLAGGVLSTAADIAKLMVALLDHEGTIGLSPAVRDDLFQVQHENAPYGSAHGLAFDVLRRGSRAIVHHGGAGPGYTSLLALAPSDQAGIYYCFTNVEPVWGTPRDKLPPDAMNLYRKVLTAFAYGDGPDPLSAPAGDASPTWQPAWGAWLGEYISVNRHYRGIGRLRTLLHPGMTIPVERGATGLKIAGIDGMRALAPGAFGAPGFAETFAFVTDPYSGHAILSPSMTSSVFERPGMADRPHLVVRLLAALLAVAATGLLFPLWPGQVGGKLARPAAALFGMAMLGIPLVLFGTHAFGERYYLGIAWPLNVARACAFLTVPIAAALVSSTVAAPSPGAVRSARLARLHLIVLTICACLTVPMLVHVGLIGFLTR